jgi:TetR/AcrR family transcriptional regulator
MPSTALRSRAASLRHPRRRAAVPPEGTRERLLAGAAAEFAARGFAGASVDRIARAARVNKAMIYYHFASKAALYREILGDMFRAVCARVRAVADTDRSPEDKLLGFTQAIAAEARARPHFPPTWFREIAEGGAHLDAATLADIAQIIATLAAIVEEGAAAGHFRRINPLVVHGGIVAPILLFFASERLRARVEKAGIPRAAQIDPEEVVAHVHRVTLAVLQQGPK